MTTLTLDEIEAAAEKIKEVMDPTPIQYSERLSAKYNAKIYLKREDLTKVRSFKLRGAYNKIASLTDTEKQNGVVCASAGNHAQGVAVSCAKHKIKGVIFMPIVTPNQKIEKVKHFGGEFIEIKVIGNTFDEANALAQSYCSENHMTYIHPFNDYKVMAGQGTIAKEIFDHLENDFDVLIATAGGGGLMAGVSSYTKLRNPNIKVVNAEPDSAPGLLESLKAGQVVTLEKMGTFVDGAAVRTVGSLTFPECAKYVDESVLVPDGQTCTSMIELYQNEGIITEPAGAISVAGLENIKDSIVGKKVVCIISGGNNDILRYPEILEKSLVYRGLKHYFIINFAQKPGQLKKLLNDVLGPNDDIVRFEYIKKNNRETGPAFVGVELKNKNDYEPLISNMDKAEIEYKVISKDDILYSYLV
jgi:threonine dehydratase